MALPVGDRVPALRVFEREEKRLVAVNHPFTAPMDEDIDRLESDP